MPIEYGSSPVEQPALQILSVRGFFQNFFVCNSGSTRFSKASYTLGYRKKLVSCVSSRSSSPSYSMLDLRMARSSSVPRTIPLARRCSRTRVEKKRSRDSSKQIPVRSSINMRISLSSCSLSPCTCPARSLRCLSRNARNNLHGVRYSLCSAHLLFRRQRDFLYEFRRLAYHVGNGVQRAARLIGKLCAAFHFLGAFFHDDHGFVGFRL